MITLWYTLNMLIARRVLAFSGRIQTYMLLLYAFVLILFALGLYFPLMSEYINSIVTVLELFTWLHIMYAGLLMLLVFFIWIKDSILPIKEVMLILTKLAAVACCVIVVYIIDSVLENGFVILF